MFNPEQLLGQMLGGALGGAFGGKRGRSNSVFSTGNVAGKAQLGIGLLGIAMAAYEHYSQPKPGAAAAGASAPPPPPARAAAIPPPPPPGMSALPPPPPVALPAPARNDMTVLIQAMIAAAAADGRIDDDERNGILMRANDAAVNADGRAFLEQELAAPKSLEHILALARPEIAGDLYAASAVAITLDTEVERAYLDRLAQGLRLDPGTRASIHQQLGFA